MQGGSVQVNRGLIMGEAYIKLHRSMLDWEWYTDVNTSRVFIHCLLSANWGDGRFKGHEIPRGSFVSSYQNLAKETGLSIQSVRTSIKRLKSTGELTVSPHAKFSIFTVVNYSKYQGANTQANNQLTDNQQTTNKQLTTIEEEKEEKEEKKNNKYICSFNDFWEAYPRKVEKARAYKSYQARLNDGYSEEDILTACKNYAKACEEDKTEAKYIKHASTFLSVHEPFLDYLKGADNGRGTRDDTADAERIREIDEYIDSGQADTEMPFM